MQLFNKSGLKFLLFSHIIAVSIWFGSVVLVSILAAYSYDYADPLAVATLLPIIPYLFEVVIFPSGTITIIQGVLYGLFTNWGFFKIFWIRIKWILIPIVSLATGLGSHDYIMKAVLALETNGYEAAMAIMPTVLFFFIIQLLCLLIMMFVSIYKPLNKRASISDNKKPSSLENKS